MGTVGVALQVLRRDPRSLHRRRGAPGSSDNPAHQHTVALDRMLIHLEIDAASGQVTVMSVALASASSVHCLEADDPPVQASGAVGAPPIDA